MSKDKAEGKRTLIVRMNDRSVKKVSIPSGCKVTFGPLCPGSKNGNHNSEGAIALRIYNGLKTTATQIACFVKVDSFYEVDSVTCIQKVTKRATKVQAYEEGGVQKNRNVSVEVSEWKDELVEEEEGAATGAQVFAALKEENDKQF